MKKIPTLFKRVYKNNKIVDILPEVTEGFEWVLNGEGDAMVRLKRSGRIFKETRIISRRTSYGDTALKFFHVCLEILKGYEECLKTPKLKALFFGKMANRSAK